MRNILRNEGFHGNQTSDKRWWLRAEEFYWRRQGTKVRIACYNATSVNEWIAAAQENEYTTGQISIMNVIVNEKSKPSS